LGEIRGKLWGGSLPRPARALGGAHDWDDGKENGGHQRPDSEKAPGGNFHLSPRLEATRLDRSAGSVPSGAWFFWFGFVPGNDVLSHGYLHRGEFGRARIVPEMSLAADLCLQRDNALVALLDAGGEGGVGGGFREKDGADLVAQAGAIFGGIGEEQDVHAGADSPGDGLLKREVIPDGAHFQIVADDHAVKAELLAQYAIDPAQRQR